MKTLAVVLLIGIAVAVIRFTLSRLRGHAENTQDPPVRLVLPETAAKRALCLGSIVSRACICEDVIQAARDSSADAERTMSEAISRQFGHMNAWLRSERLWGALSAKERSLMDKPLGAWTQQELIDAHWRTEALGVIEWALGIQQTLPPYDQPFDSAVVVRELGVLSSTTAFLAKARLRTVDEIAKARSVAELWLWRARTTQLQKKGTPPPPDATFEEIIAITAKLAGEEGLFTPIQQDFPAFGKAYSALTDDEWSLMGSIARERLYALNWLCGYATDWDSIRTDT